MKKSDISSILSDLLCDGALPGEMENFDRGAISDAAEFLSEMLIERRAGEHKIAFSTFTDKDGHRCSRIGIVNDDMPFLVDSLGQCFSAANVDIHRLIHPLADVKRGEKGQLTSIAKRELSRGDQLESIIYLETSFVSDDEVTALKDAVAICLADVSAATQDWLKVQLALGEAAALLPDGEGAALLRWLLDNNMTLLASEHLAANGNRKAKQGLSRIRKASLLSDEGRERAIEWFKAGNHAPLMLKSDIVSRVHRAVLIDLVIVPERTAGQISGLRIIGGLWTSAAMATPPSQVPLMRSHLAQMFDRLNFRPNGHAAKSLSHVMTELPHDLMIGLTLEDQERLALTAMSILDRPRPALRIVRSALRRHLYAFVWIPRDDVATQLRKSISDILIETAQADLLNWSMSLEEDNVALLRFTLDMHNRDNQVDEDALGQRIKQLVRGWSPAVADALSAFAADGNEAGDADFDTNVDALVREYSAAFPLAYRSEYGAQEAALDIMQIHRLELAVSEDKGNGEGAPVSAETYVPENCAARLYAHKHDPEHMVRLKIYHLGGPVLLSDAVPALENFGFTVHEERPTSLHNAQAVYIHDFKLKLTGAVNADALLTRKADIESAIISVLIGQAENDGLNALMTRAGLGHQPVVWLRAFFRYLRQTGVSYSIATIATALARSSAATGALINLFTALHHPDMENRNAQAEEARGDFASALAGVAALDEDRILRLFYALIEAVLRTNAWSIGKGEALAFKLDSALVPDLPKPLPWREIFVYSPRFEGIHLRAGPVARGGIRWSDRRDDFRTEILGLMKAQRVKNAVIVPTGAKGGFYPKMLPDPTLDREAWAQEGKDVYKIYIRSLLSLTDNLDGDKVIHPADIVRRDADDPYFVVAADKGTARYSDTANAIAEAENFWLDDAFASGGSHGYDHKAMAITAKGAWLSVRQHFAEMGMDPNIDHINVAGVGDMSGDVFGNGMLLSKSIRLLAAFDHRHIFIDPDPDPESSWQERRRLFHLDRSSWADYDSSLISKGGGVFPRSEKSIPLSKQMQALLGLDKAEADPQAIMSAILSAQVDLLWFGGIGTYIKSKQQSNVDVGDPANDRIRINGGQVRAKVVGEGANLGVTQAGRIEFALAGGRINTDFIDNSAGVDCSDNEVNIKIALASATRSGKLTEAARNTLLKSMTDDVADLVLEDNRLQALGLAIAQAGGASETQSYVRLIERFEDSGRLDRQVEGLADDETLIRRAQDGYGLQRPELAVLLSTAKLAMQDAIESSGLGHNAALEDELIAAFPSAMHKKFADQIKGHRLRSELVATKLGGRMINRLGLLHPFELAEEEGVAIGALAEAYWVIEQLYELQTYYQDIDKADIDENTRIALLRKLGQGVRDQMAQLIRSGFDGGKPAELLTQLRAGLQLLEGALDRPVHQEELDVPSSLGERLFRMRQLEGSFGVIALAQRRQADPVSVARAFVSLGKTLEIDWVQPCAMRMNPQDPWDRLLLAGVVRDVSQMRFEFLARARGDDFEGFVGNWLAANKARLDQFLRLSERAQNSPDCSVNILAQVAQHARLLLKR